jgi:hypothetical protein
MIPTMRAIGADDEHSDDNDSRLFEEFENDGIQKSEYDRKKIRSECQSD